MVEIALVFIIFLIIVIAWIFSENWMTPNLLFFLYWGMFIIGGFLFNINSYEWNYLSTVWIIITGIVFSLGNKLGREIIKNSKNNFLGVDKFKNNENLPNISWSLIIIFVLLGMTRTINEYMNNGISFNTIFNLDSLASINNQMAEKRYSGNENSGLISQIFLIFIYAAPLCGGYAFTYANNLSKRFISIFTFIPALGSFMINNAKSIMIASLLLWLSGLFVGYQSRYKKPIKINFRLMIKIIIFFLLFIILLVVSMLLRIGEFDMYTFRIVINKFVTYAFGHMIAFDNWFENEFFNLKLSFGKYTFFGLFNSLGLANREQGIYISRMLPSGGYSSNVYTVFRGIINDFGIIGSQVFFLISGILSGISIKSIYTKNRNNIRSKVYLSMTYFFILYSFIISAWSYMSHILAFAMFGIFLILSSYKLKK